jgi:predicted DNA-binding transcriptional regulator YafY
MQPLDIIAEAITHKKLVEFYYDGGVRIVEPHMLALNGAGHYALSAWFLSGYSKSGGQGWREYRLNGISNVATRQETFSGPRPGYKPDGGKKFHAIIARL